MANVEPIPQVPPVRNTYKMHHPPLPPLVSQANDHPAADIRMGDEILDDHIVAASLQQQSRTVLMLSNQASLHEVVASKKREASIMLESVSTVPVGPDLAQALLQGLNENTAALQQLNERTTENIAALQQLNERTTENTTALQLLNERMDESNATLQRVNERTTRIEFDVNAIRTDLSSLSLQTIRNTNRSLRGTEMIVPVPNHQGVPPPAAVFPHVQSDIVSMEECDVHTLLTFYGILPARREDLDTKKRLLCRHLGLIYL